MSCKTCKLEIPRKKVGNPPSGASFSNYFFKSKDQIDDQQKAWLKKDIDAAKSKKVDASDNNLTKFLRKLVAQNQKRERSWIPPPQDGPIKNEELLGITQKDVVDKNIEFIQKGLANEMERLSQLQEGFKFTQEALQLQDNILYYQALENLQQKNLEMASSSEGSLAAISLESINNWVNNPDFEAVDKEVSENIENVYFFSGIISRHWILTILFALGLLGLANKLRRLNMVKSVANKMRHYIARKLVSNRVVTQGDIDEMTPQLQTLRSTGDSGDGDGGDDGGDDDDDGDGGVNPQDLKHSQSDAVLTDEAKKQEQEENEDKDETQRKAGVVRRRGELKEATQQLEVANEILDRLQREKMATRTSTDTAGYDEAEEKIHKLLQLIASIETRQRMAAYRETQRIQSRNIKENKLEEEIKAHKLMMQTKFSDLKDMLTTRQSANEAYLNSSEDAKKSELADEIARLTILYNGKNQEYKKMEAQHTAMEKELQAIKSEKLREEEEE